MGSVTVTGSEYVGDVSKTTSITFECFEDFLAYDEKTRNVVKGPLTELEGDWVSWFGGFAPVGEDESVEVKLRDGKIQTE